MFNFKVRIAAFAALFLLLSSNISSFGEIFWKQANGSNCGNVNSFTFYQNNNIYACRKGNGVFVADKTSTSKNGIINSLNGNEMLQVFPIPFNSKMTISYSIPEAIKVVFKDI